MLGLELVVVLGATLLLAGVAARRLRVAGLEEVGDASVYGTLRRLFSAGLLTTYVVPSESGPHRKYYSLNAAGRDQLARSGKLWRSFATTMHGLLDDRGVAA